MAVEGVLLDIDGTLVLSNDAHAHSWVEAFAAHGYDIDYAQVRPLMGMGGDKVIPQLVSELNDEEGVGQQIAEHRKEIVINKYGPQISAANGARQMVEKLKQEGLHLIVATSASQRELDLMLKVADIEDLVEEFTSSDDAENSKPAPDIVEAALAKANLAADRSVMLGDTPYDIEAAGKAGVGVIAFRCGGFSDEDLRGAIAIYDDPADLLRNYSDSPLA